MTMAHSLRRLQPVFPHQPAGAVLGGANALETQPRPDLSVALAMERTFLDDPSNVFDQVLIAARSLRASSTRHTRRFRSGPVFVDGGTRNLLYPTDTLQAIDSTDGDRAGLTHRLDLRRAKGRPASRRWVFSWSSSFSMVNSPTFFLSRPICSSRTSALPVFPLSAT